MSSETMAERRTACWDVLLRLVRESERVLLMDAFASSRSVDFLRLALDGQPPRIMENTWRPPRRLAVDLRSFARFSAKAYGLLAAEKKRLFVWLASQKKASCCARSSLRSAASA